MTQAHQPSRQRTQGRNQHGDPLSPRHGKPFHNPTTSVHSPELLNVRCVRLGRSLQVFSPSRTLQRCPKRVTIIMSAPANTWLLWCGHRNSRQAFINMCQQCPSTREQTKKRHTNTTGTMSFSLSDWGGHFKSSHRVGLSKGVLRE